MKQKPISESDFITNKILLVFTLALVGTLALMMIGNLIDDAQTAAVTVYVLQTLAVLAGAGVVCGILRHRKEQKLSIDVSRRIMTGQNIACFFTAVLFCCVFIVAADPVAAIRTLYIIIPGSAVLYLIRAIYVREFFVISLICAFGALILWGASKILASGHVFLFPFSIAFGLLCVLALFIAMRQARRDGGVCTFGSVSIVLMDKHSEYGTSYFTLAVLSVLLLVSLFVKALLITYFSFALLAYLFIMAVYYTLKLM